MGIETNDKPAPPPWIADVEALLKDVRALTRSYRERSGGQTLLRITKLQESINSPAPRPGRVSGRLFKLRVELQRDREYTSNERSVSELSELIVRCDDVTLKVTPINTAPISRGNAVLVIMLAIPFGALCGALAGWLLADWQLPTLKPSGVAPEKTANFMRFLGGMLSPVAVFVGFILTAPYFAREILFEKLGKPSPELNRAAYSLAVLAGILAMVLIVRQ